MYVYNMMLVVGGVNRLFRWVGWGIVDQTPVSLVTRLLVAIPLGATVE
jgi:hypothetical protein